MLDSPPTISWFHFQQPPSEVAFWCTEISRCERSASMRHACAFPRRALTGPSGVTTRSGTAVQEWAWAGGNQEHGACVLATVTTPDGSTSFGVRRAPIDRPKRVMQNSTPSTCYAGPGISPPPFLTSPQARPERSPALYSSPQQTPAGFLLSSPALAKDTEC